MLKLYVYMHLCFKFHAVSMENDDDVQFCRFLKTAAKSPQIEIKDSGCIDPEKSKKSQYLVKNIWFGDPRDSCKRSWCLVTNIWFCCPKGSCKISWPVIKTTQWKRSQTVWPPAPQWYHTTTTPSPWTCSFTWNLKIAVSVQWCMVNECL